MTAREYQKRLDRLLCLTCGRHTRPQPNGQVYCPACRRLDSFVGRRREWDLVRAFAVGATATAAAAVVGVTVGTAARHFRRFRRALIDVTADDGTAAYRRLKLKPVSPPGRMAGRNPKVIGVIEVNGRTVFVRPAAPAAVVTGRLRATRTPGVVLAAPPGGGFAALRVVTAVDPTGSPAGAGVRRVVRFWATARAAVLRHRAVRWAEVDGYLAEQVCRQRMTTRGLIETLFERVGVNEKYGSGF